MTEPSGHVEHPGEAALVAVAPPGVAEPEFDLTGLSPGAVLAMRTAALEISECYRVLSRGGLNVVGELLRGHEAFFEDDHYPSGDVFDAETGSQYYYHAHRGIELEHGHFHTFLRGKGLLPDCRAAGVQADDPEVPKNSQLVHLVGISMDPWGFPMALFATNRWVTGETWLGADEIEPLLANFDIDHAWPSWPVNRWMSAMLVLFRPQVMALLRQRDELIEQWRARYPAQNPYEDTRLEMTGWVPVAPDRQTLALDALYDENGQPKAG